MRGFVAVGLVMAGVLATGCKTTRFFQVSVHPFFHTTESPGNFTGRWVSEGKAGEGLDLLVAGKADWRVSFFDTKDGKEEQTSGGVVRVGKVGGTLYWDMTAENPDSTGDLAREHLLDLHSVARLRLDGDTMEIAFLDPDWMSEALADGRVDLAHFREGEEEDGSIILTARTADLEAFLQTSGDDPGAFREPEVFHRVP